MEISDTMNIPEVINDIRAGYFVSDERKEALCIAWERQAGELVAFRVERKVDMPVLLTEMATLRAENKFLCEKLRLADATMGNYHAEMDRLADSAKEVPVLIKERDALRINIEIQRRHLIAAGEDSKKAEQELAELRAKLERVPEDVESVVNERNALREMLEDYKTDNAAMTAMNEEANKDLMECKRQYAQMADERDAEMLRTKACEAIAEGQEGWERLTNECPSTAAVAALRSHSQLQSKELGRLAKARGALETERDELKEHIRRANKALETPLGNP